MNFFFYMLLIFCGIILFQTVSQWPLSIRYFKIMKVSTKRCKSEVCQCKTFNIHIMCVPGKIPGAKAYRPQEDFQSPDSVLHSTGHTHKHTTQLKYPHIKDTGRLRKRSRISHVTYHFENNTLYK